MYHVVKWIIFSFHQAAGFVIATSFTTRLLKTRKRKNMRTTPIATPPRREYTVSIYLKMMNYFHKMEVMIDIETLSTRPDASIIAIGAMKFSRRGRLRKFDEMNKFYRCVDMKSCEDYDLHIDPDTVTWWTKQPREVQEAVLTNPNRKPLLDVLEELSDWIGGARYIWCQGTSFDPVILEHAYKVCSVPVPWKYWNTRDVRTLMDVMGIDLRTLHPTGKHHPLHDCYRQIMGVKEAYNAIEES